MTRSVFAILIVMLATSASADEAKISSLAIGMHQSGEEAMLAPAFINAVNRYLSRYEPRLILRGAAHVKMMVDYDYDYAIELQVNDKEYEITVTLHEQTGRTAKAQKQAAKLASGVHRTMETYLIRSARARGNADK